VASVEGAAGNILLPALAQKLFAADRTWTRFVGFTIVAIDGVDLASYLRMLLTRTRCCTTTVADLKGGRISLKDRQIPVTQWEAIAEETSSVYVYDEWCCCDDHRTRHSRSPSRSCGLQLITQKPIRGLSCICTQ
jgi:hypothetical protein